MIDRYRVTACVVQGLIGGALALLSIAIYYIDPTGYLTPAIAVFVIGLVIAEGGFYLVARSLGFRLTIRKGGGQGAAPNGGPAAQLGNSEVTEGPPSVNSLGTMKSGLARKLAVLAFLLLSILMVRFAIPIGIDGDWSGSVTQCMCGHWNLMRFDDGRVTSYGHGGQPAELAAWGAYERVGRNTYEWTLPKCPPTTVKVGWFISSYQGGPLQQGEVLHCWRYPFVWRADKLFSKCEQVTADKRADATSNRDTQDAAAEPPPAAAVPKASGKTNPKAESEAPTDSGGR